MDENEIADLVAWCQEIMRRYRAADGGKRSRDAKWRVKDTRWIELFKRRSVIEETIRIEKDPTGRTSNRREREASKLLDVVDDELGELRKWYDDHFIEPPPDPRLLGKSKGLTLGQRVRGFPGRAIGPMIACDQLDRFAGYKRIDIAKALGTSRGSVTNWLERVPTYYPAAIKKVKKVK